VLLATDQALADELAAAAGVLMGKAAGTPAVLVRGACGPPGVGALGELVRPARHDLFRGEGSGIVAGLTEGRGASRLIGTKGRTTYGAWHQ
jgi:F420-0:gamma-glutamyl ligase